MKMGVEAFSWAGAWLGSKDIKRSPRNNLGNGTR